MINLDRQLATPLYIQLTNELISKILEGIIIAGVKLPSSREMAELMDLNRRTIIAAYEELEAQGWINIIPNKGSFIHHKIPKLHKTIWDDLPQEARPTTTGYELEEKFNFLEYYNPPVDEKIKWVIDAGYPDTRLAPIKELTQNLSTINRTANRKLWKYANNFKGDKLLRQEIKKYLAETRGIKTRIENIYISRGSLMAFYLIFQVLIKKGDKVVVANPSFKVANNIIRLAEGELLEISVDEHGIDVDSIEKICKKQKIRAVFIMPHHHNPTTVSLCAERRMKLLLLAQKYGFAIIEDDYDYDYHYDHSPILPMISYDKRNHVIYAGSLSKTVAPSLRMGFIVGPEELIEEVVRLSRFIDVHGNIALERAIGELYRDGEIKRHLNKTVKIYEQRRDLFCMKLKKAFGDLVKFKIPEGGLAVWVVFDSCLPLIELRNIALKNGLQIPKPVFTDQNDQAINGIRMGFASLNEQEIDTVIDCLKLSAEEIIE